MEVKQDVRKRRRGKGRKRREGGKDREKKRRG